MLAYPLQPCPACLQTSVRLCEGAGQIPTIELPKQLSTGEEWRLMGEGNRPGVKSEEKRWHPERALLYFCTACRYARLSISGLLRGEPAPGQYTTGESRECSCRVLVLHHEVRLCDEGDRPDALGDRCIDGSRNGGSQEGEDKVWLASPERRLVQQFVSPVVFVSEELPEEETYTPAKWRYFIGGGEVCREVFQKRLDRAYAACVGGPIESI
ncbi:hypothetical protein GGQ19_002543 [Salinibacter ruber]|nr:hypothetical protein [Salinibacter ruber]